MVAEHKCNREPSPVTCVIGGRAGQTRKRACSISIRCPARPVAAAVIGVYVRCIGVGIILSDQLLLIIVVVPCDKSCRVGDCLDIAERIIRISVTARRCSNG